MKDFVARIHLKIAGENSKTREEIIEFCLGNKEEQCLAIGWGVDFYGENEWYDGISYQDYYNIVKKTLKQNGKRITPSVLNVFLDAEPDDLFWTRDLNGCYWICRAKEKAKPYYADTIGAVLPVEAYRVGLEVPGQIKASFNRPRGGTSERIKDEAIVEFSKYIYNTCAGKTYYSYIKKKDDFLNNLPDFELEELVISYLQIKENYYVLSNSIAQKSTTVKIECELRSRDILKKTRKAVVQVKGGNRTEINAENYKEFADDGYFVYLYAPKIINKDEVNNVVEITKEELLSFYKEYKEILPESITKWENIFEL